MKAPGERGMRLGGDEVGQLLHGLIGRLMSFSSEATKGPTGQAIAKG